MPPATPTAVDANLERKAALEDATLWKQRRDIWCAEAQQWEKVLGAVKAEIRAHTGLALDVADFDGIVTKTLRDARNSLTSEIDVLQATKSQREAELSGIETDLGTKKLLIGRMTVQADALRTDIATLEATSSSLKRDYLETIEKKNTELSELLKTISDTQASFDAQEKEYQSKKQWIMDEETRLATKSADLAIYEARIRRLAAEVGLELPTDI